MTFRQRLAWLLLFLYLICTCTFLYYIFQINEHYSIYALEHTDVHMPKLAEDLRRPNFRSTGITPQQKVFQTTKAVDPTPPSDVWLLVQHIFDIPFVLLLALFASIYLQVFCNLWMCTRPEMPPVCMRLWPVYFYCSVRSWCRT